MSTHPKLRLSPEQYLEIERKAEFKSEYYQGEMFAMAGAREPHNLIVTNVIMSLGPQLRRHGCRVYASDMRVLVGSCGLYTYPDVIAVCGQPKFVDLERDTITNPCLVIEVLSPSTEAYDRGWKFEQYRSVESITDYLMIASTHVLAEYYTRRPDIWALRSFSRLEDRFSIESAGATISLADIYELVVFQPNLSSERPGPPGAGST